MSILEEAVMLLPCPLCGCAPQPVPQNTSHYRKGGDGYTVFIWCENCNAQSGDYDTDELAIAAWNRRAIPSTGSGETGWQDIETVPKDGTWLDLWAGDRRVPDVRWAENDEPDEYGFTGGWVNVKGEFALGEDEPPMFWMRVERPSSANPAETQAGEMGRDGVGNDNDGREDSQP